MKSFKLREEKTFIKILKEPPIKKKKTNWSRSVYLGLFLIVVFMVGKRFYNGQMVIFADGQIDLAKQTINFPHDIQLQSVFIEEGEAICTGDTLFSYQVLADDLDNSDLLIQQKPIDWILKEKMAAERRIALLKVSMHNKQDLVDLLKGQAEIKESLVLVGLHDEYDDYSNLRDKIAEVEASIVALEKERKVYQSYISKLTSSERSIQEINTNAFASNLELKYFIAPLDGVVSDIFYATNEICYKKEEMLTIHQRGAASINTYFDANEIPYLKIGDQVKVEFPDGTKSKGVIHKFYVSTYALPSEFQKKYEPTERNIVAEVLPVDQSNETSWRKFYKMNVKVSKTRYQISI